LRFAHVNIYTLVHRNTVSNYPSFEIAIKVFGIADFYSDDSPRWIRIRPDRFIKAIEAITGMHPGGSTGQRVTMKPSVRSGVYRLPPYAI